jgi:hypothetical protein
MRDVAGRHLPEALAMQIAAYRRMGAEARVELAARMSDEVREIALAGIRSRHPEYSEDEARDALHRLLYGDELFRAVWPGRPLIRP